MSLILRAAGRAASVSLLALAAPAFAQSEAPSQDAVLKTYADIALATYEDALTRAKALEEANKALTENASDETLAAAREAWKASRPAYQQTEAFRFGNPSVGIERKVRSVLLECPQRYDDRHGPVQQVGRLWRRSEHHDHRVAAAPAQHLDTPLEPGAPLVVHQRLGHPHPRARTRGEQQPGGRGGGRIDGGHGSIVPGTLDPSGARG